MVLCILCLWVISVDRRQAIHCLYGLIAERVRVQQSLLVVVIVGCCDCSLSLFVDLAISGAIFVVACRAALE